MQFLENIFVGEGVSQSTLADLRQEKVHTQAFCLCVDPNSQNLLEILAAFELFHTRNRKKKYVVIGVSLTRDAAYDLLCGILAQHLQNGLALDQFKDTMIRGCEMEHV